jgi:hypothetical protein
VLLDATTPLPDGTRVRLRLPHRADLDGLRALARRLGLAVDELEIARALRFDPRRRAVAVATVWVDDHEVLVGYGAIELGEAQPDNFVVDEQLAPGLRAVLHEALVERAGGIRAA